MPSGPKKRRASRRKLPKAELFSSTAGATESCIGSMETDVAAEKDVSNTLLESEVMELPNCNIGGDKPKENDGSAVPEVVSDVVACGTCLSQLAVKNEIGSMETDVAAEVSNVAVPKEVSSEVAVESDGIVIGAAQLASKKDNKYIESFPREGRDSPALNGGCMFMEQADHVQDVRLNVKDSKDTLPLKKLNDAVQVSQQVEEHAYNKHQEPVDMELLNGKDGNVQKEYGCFDGGISVPEVISGVEVAVKNHIGIDANKLASKKDENSSESVGDDSPSAAVGDDGAIPGNFPKLLDLVEQIEHLVLVAKGLIAQQKMKM